MLTHQLTLVQELFQLQEVTADPNPRTDLPGLDDLNYQQGCFIAQREISQAQAGIQELACSSSQR